jgi:outer membrane protein OmpA-like peptidoglycan-associated protein
LSNDVVESVDAQTTVGDGGFSADDTGAPAVAGGPTDATAQELSPYVRVEDPPVRTEVAFQANSLRLKADANAIIDAVAALLKQHPEIRLVEVEGHAARSERRSGKRLARDRANLVMKKLIERGIAPERFKTKASEADPVDPANRDPTVTFHVLATN